MKNHKNLSCPNCGKPIRWYRITGKFSCPSCGAHLAANPLAPAIVVVVIVIWSFIELIMRELVAGLGLAGQILVILPSLLIGLLLLGSIYVRNVTVRTADSSEKDNSKKREKKDT